jgi:signal transduction histidine kinase
MLSEEISALRSEITELALSDVEKARLFTRLHEIEMHAALVETGTTFDLLPEPSTRQTHYSKLVEPEAVTTREFITQLTSLRDSQQLLTFAITSLAEQLGAYYGGAMLVNTTMDCVVTTAVNNASHNKLIEQAHSIPLNALEELGWIYTKRALTVVHAEDGGALFMNDPIFAETQTRILIPLITRTELLGLLDLHLDFWRIFDKNEIESLRYLGRQISAALENARLFEAEHRQRKIGETLREINLVISTLDQDDVLELILEQIGRLIPYDSAGLWLDMGNGKFRMESSIGYERFGALGKIARNVMTTDQPLVRELASQSRIITIPNVRDDPRWIAFEGLEWIHSWIGTRLTMRGKTIGLLMLDHIQSGFYGLEHEALLETMVTQILIAVENAQLFQSERRQREIANTLRDISTVLVSTLDPQEVLQRILEQVARVIPYDAASIWLDDGSGELRVAAAIGYEKFGNAEQLETLHFSRIDDPFIGRLDTARQALTIPDLSVVSSGRVEGFEWVRSWATALIKVRGKVIGNLALDHMQPGFYGAQHEPILEALATQFSIAIENARLFEVVTRTMNELTRSNDELQQFAYVASHDLQEPLRTIASYVQLLAKRYRGKLDKDADDFINFAVDGAHRMQNLINDLLQYSRVGTQAKPFEITDCNEVLQQALYNLQLAIEEKGATITSDALPIIVGDPIQLTGVFQNLIGNAIKFHGEAAPFVHISAERRGEQWLFSVKDNGIGIAPQYADRIFIIFKRLHTAAEYPGTGVGLSICKKVVERHGGRIWVDSQVGHGSTFYFTLPARSHE